jgi:hypothetical protein
VIPVKKKIFSVLKKIENQHLFFRKIPEKNTEEKREEAR